MLYLFLTLVLSGIIGGSRLAAQESLSAHTYLSPGTDSSIQKIIGREGLVVFKLRVNGRPARFLFDTGAPTIISEAIQRRQRFPVQESVRVFDAYRNSSVANVVRVSAISVGEIEIRNIPALVVSSQHSLLEALGVDGILGSNALKQLCVRIDGRENRISFYPMLLEKASNATTLSTNGDAQGTPEIMVRIDDHEPASFIFDSGYQGFCDISRQDAAVMPASVVAVRATRNAAPHAGFFGDAPDDLEQLRLNTVTVCGTTFYRPSATISNDTKSKLGALLFRKGVVTLNFRDSWFSFQPYAR